MDEEDEHSPSEFYYPEDLETFDVETETGITEFHIIINNLLTARAVLGNIGPRWSQNGQSELRSVSKRLLFIIEGRLRFKEKKFVICNLIGPQI